MVGYRRSNSVTQANGDRRFLVAAYLVGRHGEDKWRNSRENHAFDRRNSQLVITGIGGGALRPRNNGATNGIDRVCQPDAGAPVFIETASGIHGAYARAPDRPGYLGTVINNGARLVVFVEVPGNDNVFVVNNGINKPYCLMLPVAFNQMPECDQRVAGFNGFINQVGVMQEIDVFVGNGKQPATLFRVAKGAGKGEKAGRFIRQRIINIAEGQLSIGQ